MAVLSPILFFFIIFLVAINKMKVICDICVMILINIWIILFDVYSDHFCRAENGFIILFVYDKMCEQKVRMLQLLQYWVQHSSSYFYTFFFQNIGDCNYVIMFTVIFHFYIPRQNRKYITSVPSCSRLPSHWKRYQTCTYRHITTGLMI